MRRGPGHEVGTAVAVARHRRGESEGTRANARTDLVRAVGLAVLAAHWSPHGSLEHPGAAHYSLSRNVSTLLPVPGEIHAITHLGGALGTIFASTHGLFRVVGAKVSPLPIDWER